MMGHPQLLVALLIAAVSGIANAASLPVIIGLSGDDTRHGIEWISGSPPDWQEVQTTRYHVDTLVQSRFARTKVEAEITNYVDSPRNFTFPFAVPEAAMLVSFEIDADGETYTASAMVRDDVHIDVASTSATIKARDSVSFDVELGMRRSGSVTVRLEYEELLTRRLEVYKNVQQVWPGTVVRDFRLSVRVREATFITRFNHTFSNNAGVNGTKTLSTLPFASPLGVKSANATEVEFVLQPSIEEQRDLATQLGLDAANGLAGQWVVEYDVERYPTAGDIVLHDGYFAHFFAPSDLQPLPKYALFLLDVSGSMNGRKIQQLREAMTTILGEIGPQDFFTVIEFSSSNTMWDLGPAGVHPTCNVYPASYVKQAQARASQMVANGGTALMGGLTLALECAGAGPHGLEPILMVLTDGQPTDKKTDQIETETSQLNRRVGPNGQQELLSSLFALALGDDADLEFLRRLSLNNGGDARQIYVAEDASTQLQDFYRSIATPLLKNVSISFNYQQADQETVTQNDFRTYFWGSELVVAGKLSGALNATDSLTGVVTAIGAGGQAVQYPLQVTTSPNWQPERLGPEAQANSERLWAHLMTSQLLDIAAVSNNSDAKVADQKAIALALKYSLVTPKTCLAIDITAPHNGPTKPPTTPATQPPPRPATSTTSTTRRPTTNPTTRPTTNPTTRPTTSPTTRDPTTVPPPGPQPGPQGGQNVANVGSISIGTLNVNGPLIQFNLRR